MRSSSSDMVTSGTGVNSTSWNDEGLERGIKSVEKGLFPSDTRLFGTEAPSFWELFCLSLELTPHPSAIVRATSSLEAPSLLKSIPPPPPPPTPPGPFVPSLQNRRYFFKFFQSIEGQRTSFVARLSSGAPRLLRACLRSPGKRRKKHSCFAGQFVPLSQLLRKLSIWIPVYLALCA